MTTQLELERSETTVRPEIEFLDVEKAPEVAYCIPLWLRDEQIKYATKRIRARIEPHHEPRPEAVAVVGFGPSLNDTWEGIRDFPFVISCSGSHKFLVERGIIPNWHVEVDPRPHKVQLIGEPQPSTTYLIASTCNKAVLDHLASHDVRLWHVFDNTEEGRRVLPPEEWAITGGCDVGLRALTIAAFLGFRDLHVFGLDGNAREQKHAAFHPNSPKKYSLVRYDGVEYRTTPGLLAAAQQVWHELDQMPKVHATFYGDGLIQAMAKNYRAKHKHSANHLVNVIAFTKPELISAEYRQLNAQLHEETPSYGVGGGKHAETVVELARKIQAGAILDYGCGKGYLAKALPFPIWEYDPAIPEKAEPPRPADLVICTDVLEHIEPDKLDFVLDDLRRVTMKVGFFVIHTGPAVKKLPDGRNTHLIQQGEAWWRKRLGQFFAIGKIFHVGPQLFVIVGRGGT